MIFGTGFKLNKIFIKEIIAGGFIRYKFLRYASMIRTMNKTFCYNIFHFISCYRDWILISKFKLTPHSTFNKFVMYIFIIFPSINFSISLIFDDLFKKLLTTGVSSCISSCSKPHLFKLLLDLVRRISSCFNTFSNKLLLSFKLLKYSFIISPLCSAIVASTLLRLLCCDLDVWLGSKCALLNLNKNLVQQHLFHQHSSLHSLPFWSFCPLLI